MLGSLTNLHSQLCHCLHNQMDNRRIFCRPPCWHMFVCYRIRRCCSDTRSRLNKQNCVAHNSTSPSCGLSNTVPKASHTLFTLQQTRWPAYTDLCSRYRQIFCTRMNSCRIFCHPPCWYMFFCCRSRRCCPGTRPRLIDGCVVCRYQQIHTGQGKLCVFHNSKNTSHCLQT